MVMMKKKKKKEKKERTKSNCRECMTFMDVFKASSTEKVNLKALA
jgi:hypothetical protein